MRTSDPISNIAMEQTFTGLCIDFASLSPSHYKVSLVSVLDFHTFQIRSSFASFHKEIVQGSLLENRFPLTLIDKVLRTFLNQQYSLSAKAQYKEEEKPSIIFCLPYLGHLGFRIRNNVNRLYKGFYRNIKVYVQPNN